MLSINLDYSMCTYVQMLAHLLMHYNYDERNVSLGEDFERTRWSQVFSHFECYNVGTGLDHQLISHPAK